MDNSLKPTFLLSKSQRRLNKENIQTFKVELIDHYAQIYATRFKWSGTPSDMPIDYIEKALFYTGGIAPIKAFNEEHLIASKVVKFGLYGQPITHIPEIFNSSVVPSSLLVEQHLNIKDPMLFLNKVPLFNIDNLINLMARAYMVLKMNLIGMQQPVVIRGAVGGEIGILKCEEDIEDCEYKIPSLEKTITECQVLDLGSKDYTQNIISTINHLDCEILARMGIKSAGTEKASGVTTEETLSINQELALINQIDYEVRTMWLNNPIIKERYPNLKCEPAKVLDLGVNDGFRDTIKEPVKA